MGLYDFPNTLCVSPNSEVVHGSGANKSKKDRIGFVIGYKNITAKINKKKLNQYKKTVEANLKFIKKIRSI